MMTELTIKARHPVKQARYPWARKHLFGRAALHGRPPLDIIGSRLAAIG